MKNLVGCIIIFFIIIGGCHCLQKRIDADRLNLVEGLKKYPQCTTASSPYRCINLNEQLAKFKG